MAVDYGAAFRDGCKESPRAVIERTEVEDVVAEMCKAATEEAAKVFRLPDNRGASLAFIALTHTEEREQFRPNVAIPIDHARVYLMHGEWDRVRDIPAQHGVELLTYRRGPLGYPVKITSFDGKEALCQSRGQLEAALGNILRSPHTGARIRNAARDFAARPTNP